MATANPAASRRVPFKTFGTAPGRHQGHESGPSGSNGQERSCIGGLQALLTVEAALQVVPYHGEKSSQRCKVGCWMSYSCTPVSMPYIAQVRPYPQPERWKAPRVLSHGFSKRHNQDGEPPLLGSMCLCLHCTSTKPAGKPILQKSSVSSATLGTE